MTESELKEKVEEIAEGVKLFDTHVCIDDYETGEGKLTKKQTQIVQMLFEVFRALRWQLPFNSFKELKYAENSALKQGGCGTPVRISPCGDEYGGKTYFGVLLGDIAQSISHTIKDDVVTASHGFSNPSIFVPELKKVIFGRESWWGEIKTQDDIDKLITDETIQNVWYVKLPKELVAPGADEAEESESREEKRAPKFWSCDESAERLVHEDMDQAIYDFLNELERDPEEVAVFGYAPMEISATPCEPLERILEDLDEEFGDPDGSYTKPTRLMKEAERIFMATVLSEYVPWACDRIEKRMINVKEWRRAWEERHE